MGVSKMQLIKENNWKVAENEIIISPTVFVTGLQFAEVSSGHQRFKSKYVI